jgi:microcystin degradation protein MlrC
MGCSVVVTADRDDTLADNVVSELSRDFWDRRRAFDVALVSPAEAIARALGIPGGPVVLSESSDSTGSGSPGDSAGLLRALLRARLREPACIFLVDPAAVDAAMSAGVGATLAIKIGGAFDRKHSKPVAVKARVRMLSDGRWTPRAPGYNPGIEQTMGRAAVLEVGRLQILAAERSTMTVDPELFRSHGLDPAYMKIVAVKSPNGFRSAYAPLAKAMMVVDTPGVSTANLQKLPFRRIPRPLYPFDPGLRLRLPKDF